MELSKCSQVTEIAYQILFSSGKAIYFRDLISKILTTNGSQPVSRSQAITEIHTQINMDSRFIYYGQGMWGLAEWLPRRKEENSNGGDEQEDQEEEEKEQEQQDDIVG